MKCDVGEVIFTRGTTESINLLASSLGQLLGTSLVGKSIVVSELEHHANIVPWQMLCERSGATLRVIPLDEHGVVSLASARELIDSTTAIVSIVHVSNTLGTVQPVQEICALARTVDAFSIVDAAQSVVHHAIDMRSLGCDFIVWSGHKLYGPTGIGVLCGRAEVLERMPPYQGGGAMIEDVQWERSTYQLPPLRFEAGTPNMEGAIGLAAAITWLKGQDRVLLEAHELACTQRIESAIAAHPHARLLGGPDAMRMGIVSFVVDGVHAQDIGVLLDEQGVAIRTGHHCTMPLLRRLGVSSAARVSVAAYTSESDLKAFEVSLAKTLRLLAA
jgi:SufS family cysteine desulfurase